LCLRSILFQNILPAWWADRKPSASVTLRSGLPDTNEGIAGLPRRDADVFDFKFTQVSRRQVLAEILNRQLFVLRLSFSTIKAYPSATVNSCRNVE
jgi:hypothetical protein